MAGSKQIINATDVRTRYSLQDLADVNSALESGIASAHLFFQGILGTPFDEATLTETFYLDSAIIPAYNQQFRLRLTQAFVKPGSVSLTSGTKRVSSDSVAADDFYIDADRGLVFLSEANESGTNYANKFVSVTYTAGFGTAVDSTLPPAWLRESLLSWMSSVLVFSAYKEEPGKAVPLAESIKRDAAAMVERYKRETALQFLPITY